MSSIPEHEEAGMVEEDPIGARLMRKVKGKAGIHEVWQERIFTAYRETADGGTESVKLTLLDRGTGHKTRFNLTAETEDGRVASGNSGDSIERVVAGLHWFNLERAAPDVELGG